MCLKQRTSPEPLQCRHRSGRAPRSSLCRQIAPAQICSKQAVSKQGITTGAVAGASLKTVGFGKHVSTSDSQLQKLLCLWQHYRAAGCLRAMRD